MNQILEILKLQSEIDFFNNKKQWYETEFKRYFSIARYLIDDHDKWTHHL